MEACAFCPDIAVMTGEHLFDDWVNRVLNSAKSKGYKITKYDAGFAAQGQRVVAGSWHTQAINLKGKVVCGDCNNVWMSQLSDRVSSSVVRDMVASTSSVTLSRRDCALMTAYAFMKSVVTDHMHPTRRPFFRPSVRHAFAADLKCPATTQAWLGCFNSRINRNRGFISGHYLRPRNGSVKGFEIYVFTYVINHVALQIASYRWIKPGPRRAPVPRLRMHPMWAEASHEIYPLPAESLVWPPPRLISDDTIQAFSDRWSRLEFPS